MDAGTASLVGGVIGAVIGAGAATAAPWTTHRLQRRALMAERNRQAYEELLSALEELQGCAAIDGDMWDAASDRTIEALASLPPVGTQPVRSRAETLLDEVVEYHQKLLVLLAVNAAREPDESVAGVETYYHDAAGLDVYHLQRSTLAGWDRLRAQIDHELRA